ncbi:MAG: hypothetical protein KC437_07515, partial [Flavobacteriales bacterium]|nr:hypothetical protein [Flavobacteriales bacterium]
MKIKLLLLALLAALYVTGQNKGVHSYAIDLTHVVEDRVKVTIDASLAQLSNPKDNQYKFHFPATIPGTYATLDYGRFIQDFKAYNTGGQPLKVKHKGNTFTIYGKPERIEYWADDTFDARIRKNKVFEPAGTNNQERTNFLLNAAGYFGFFEGKEALPVALEI